MVEYTPTPQSCQPRVQVWGNASNRKSQDQVYGKKVLKYLVRRILRRENKANEK